MRARRECTGTLEYRAHGRQVERKDCLFCELVPEVRAHDLAGSAAPPDFALKSPQRRRPKREASWVSLRCSSSLSPMSGTLAVRRGAAHLGGAGTPVLPETSEGSGARRHVRPQIDPRCLPEGASRMPGRRLDSRSASRDDVSNSSLPFDPSFDRELEATDETRAVFFGMCGPMARCRPTRARSRSSAKRRGSMPSQFCPTGRGRLRPQIDPCRLPATASRVTQVAAVSMPWVSIAAHHTDMGRMGAKGSGRMPPPATQMLPNIRTCWRAWR